MSPALLSGVRDRLSSWDFEVLNANFTREEVLQALKQLNPSKSPEPAGMTALFYQHYLEILQDLVHVILRCLNEGLPVDAINNTSIVLLPKLKDPQTPKDFRPISLCNALYRLISKVIVNRLKPVMPNLIGKNQAAFVAGRLMHENAMVASEIIHCMKNKGSGRNGLIAVKLDMAKAYDGMGIHRAYFMVYGVSFSLGFINHGMCIECYVFGGSEWGTVGCVYTYLWHSTGGILYPPIFSSFL